MKINETGSIKAVLAMKRGIETLYPVSDKEYEAVARQVARDYNVSWRWSEDHYSIEFYVDREEKR